MNRVDRISPSFGGHRLPPSDTNRQLRRPNLSSLSHINYDSDSNPTSTKIRQANLNQFQPQTSTSNQKVQFPQQLTKKPLSLCNNSIFSGSLIGSTSNNNSKKALLIPKPQISVTNKIFDINKFTQLVSSKSTDKSPLFSNSQLRIKKIIKQEVGKENIFPNKNSQQKYDINPFQPKSGSRSNHEQDFQEAYKNYASSNAESKEREKPQKLHHRTVSQDQNMIKKETTRSIAIELDMLCQEKPYGSHQQIKLESSEQCGFDEETIYHLYKREQVYQVSPNYERIQPQINSIMRAVLIDWLTEVCKEFTLKRETLHLAVHNFDRFMARRENIQRSELQLVGVTSLYIACKIEEIYPPKVSDFSQASNYGFTVQQILEKELEICGVLKWFLNPPTLYLWSTWYMSQWDLFFKQNSTKIKFPVTLYLYQVKKDKVFSFKQSNQLSYVMYRQFMNLLDCSILDIKTFKYSNREIVASLIFLITLQQYLGVPLSKLKEILQTKQCNREVVQFQQLFVEYIQLCFGFGFQHIQNPVKYFINFLTLEMVIDQPGSSKIPQEKEMEEHYEYFLSIQTHSQEHLVFIRQKLNKSIV